MISILDLVGAAFAGTSIMLLFTVWKKRLAREEKIIILLLCLLTALINAMSFWSWLGRNVSDSLAENWGDYLQVLQPALWGMFFYVVVQSAQKRELKKSRSKMRAIVENMPVILHAYDKQGRLTAWNRQAVESSGISRDEILGKDGMLKAVFLDSDIQDQVKGECLQGGGHYQNLVRRMKSPDGERHVAWYNISKEFPIEGWANWGIGLDITEQISARKELEYLATHDELTMLPNRALLRDRLHHSLTLAQRNNAMGALLMFDLDHFKMVNDRYGHPVGDQLLRNLGDRIYASLKATDTLARVSGDEFMILLEQVNSPSEVALVADRILSSLSQEPFNIFGNEIRVQASIGITVFPDDDVRLDELMKNVDLALYSAKESGRNNYHFYSREMHKKLRWQHSVSEKLRVALDENHLCLHYQPLIETQNQSISGVEALLRWPTFNEGKLSPAQFIPIAESVGLMPVLGSWVVKSAFTQAADWQQTNKNLSVAINLSALQLYQINLANFFKEALEEFNLDPQKIELEITESAVMCDMPRAVETMKRLADQGFKLSLDDFGTGYSSLSYLNKFPVSKIKIDQSFIGGLGKDAYDTTIVESVIRLGHSLGLKIVAEGVETEDQFHRLNEEGCDYIQGYYFSKALSANALEDLLAGGLSPTH